MPTFRPWPARSVSYIVGTMLLLIAAAAAPPPPKPQPRAAVAQAPAAPADVTFIEWQTFLSLPPSAQDRIRAAGAAPSILSARTPATPAGEPRTSAPSATPATDAEYARIAHLISRPGYERARPAHRAMLQRLVDPPAERDGPRPHLCFTRDTDSELVEAINRALGELQPIAFQQTQRWFSTALSGSGLQQGDPTTLTYSFVPDGTVIPDLIGVTGLSNLHAFLNDLYGSEAVWKDLYAQVFERWSEVCGLTFVLEPNDDGTELNDLPGAIGIRGDLRLAGMPIDGNSGTLAYNNFPPDGDMVLDTSDDFFDFTALNSRRLRNTLAHEHGHGHGQLHVCPDDRSKLMEPFIYTVFDGPQLDDILSAQRHYGDRWEHNDTVGAAADLGAMPVDTTYTFEYLSIDSIIDVDYFTFDIPDRKLVTLVVSPLGAPYLEGPQTEACNNGTLYDPVQRRDLLVELRDTDGATQLAIGNTQPIGGVETAEAIVPDAGTYYVFVRGGLVDDIQGYQLEITVAPPPFMGMEISLPEPAPTTLDPTQPTTFDVIIDANDEAIAPGGALLNYRYDGGPYLSTPLADLGDDLYRATLPAPDCNDTPEFYISVDATVSGLLTLPVDGPAAPFVASPGVFEIPFADDFETDQGWQVSTTAADGGWDRGDPVNAGRGDPAFDYDGSGQCYLTDNVFGNSDVDAGSTTLTSPAFDLSAGGAIDFAWWLNTAVGSSVGAEDGFDVEVATNAAGDDWVLLRHYDTPISQWHTETITVGPDGEVSASPTIRIRFTVTDDPPGNIIEGALDAVVVTTFVCDTPCIGDLNGDDAVDFDDLTDLLGLWGPCPAPCPADLAQNDETVDIDDLATLLGFWGPCP